MARLLHSPLQSSTPAVLPYRGDVPQLSAHQFSTCRTSGTRRPDVAAQLREGRVLLPQDPPPVWSSNKRPRITESIHRAGALYPHVRSYELCPQGRLASCWRCEDEPDVPQGCRLPSSPRKHMIITCSQSWSCPPKPINHLPHAAMSEKKNGIKT